jgi:PTH1 family peptidyl-tRNA hydrolase
VTPRSTIRLIKPVTFMNGSGLAVAEALDHLSLTCSESLVVLDDFQLPLGSLRLRPGGSDGGHNGLASVLASVGTEEIPRLRLGIGQSVMPPAEERRDFVLAPFDRPEWEVAREMITRAADAAAAFASFGIEHAMNLYNAQ